MDQQTGLPICKMTDVEWDPTAPGEPHEKYIWKGEGSHGPIRTVPFTKDDPAPVQSQGTHLGPNKLLPEELVGSPSVCFWNLRAISGFLCPWKHFRGFCVDPKCNLIHGYYAIDSQIKKCIECHQKRINEERAKVQLAKAQVACDEPELEDYSNPSDESEDGEYNMVEGLPDHDDDDSCAEACMEYDENEDWMQAPDDE